MRTLSPLSLGEFDATPFRFTATARLAAEPHAVFAELGDMSLWFPMMTRSVWRTGATGGVGARRDVSIALFGKFREEMLAWDVDQRVAFTMIGTTSPLVAQMGEEWLMERAGGATQLSWTVVARPSALGRAATPVLRASMRVMFLAGARALEKRAGSYPRAKQVS